MNDIDKKILSLLQTNADIPIAELSKKINLSPSPCWLRISKLYKQGYIKKKVAVIDRTKINLSVVAFVQIKTNQHNMNWSKKFLESVKEMDEVVEFYRLSGTIDYLLKVLVPSIEKFDEFYKAEDKHQDYYQEYFLNYLRYKKACRREKILNNIWGS